MNLFRFRYRILFLTPFILFCIFSCSENWKGNDAKKQFASLSDSASYVGIQSCRTCHEDKYETFIHTGMGSSFDKASKSKTSAVFSSHSLIHDSIKDLFYHPFWDKDSFKVTEFRLLKGDTVYKRTENVSWIVGSGQHTNSHLMNVNGYVYQLPLTFYTQKKQWDLPPGFEDGFNSRFSRSIGLECITCHNAYPEFISGSENKFKSIPNGIDCERCHGPGSMHVKDMLAGNFVDVEKEIDYSIVNPAKLPVNLQLDVCQRCHIQGNAVLKDGKSFLDFRPGMHLSDVMDVFMPVYKGDDDSHIMASHAERLKLSKCFMNSLEIAQSTEENNHQLKPYKNAMTCVTCHNPHISVKNTDAALFNSKCASCHHQPGLKKSNDNAVISAALCKELLTERNKTGDNCIQCHMPKGGSIDIPHVSTTDHMIRIPRKKISSDKFREFAGLACINNDKVSSKAKGVAFLSYFEKFSANPAFLDSALRYFNESGKDSIISNFKNLVRLYYLKNDFKKVIDYTLLHGKVIQVLINKSLTNDDAWTAYRIGESYFQTGDIKQAVVFFDRAVMLAPFQLDFRNKLANAQQEMGLIAEARKNFEFIIMENPDYSSAYVNYGFLMLTSFNDISSADKAYDKALSLDPDNIQAMFNKAGVMVFQEKYMQAKQYLKEILRKEPTNEKAGYLLKDLEKRKLK